MEIGNQSLFISLLFLSLIRFVGILISLDIFLSTRERHQILFISAWIFGCVGSILGLITLYNVPSDISSQLWTLFSLFAGVSTIFIAFGVMSYFRKFRVSYIIFGNIAFILLAILVRRIFSVDISDPFTLFVQAGFLIFLITTAIFQRKLFKRVAGQSYKWLLASAGIGIGHTFGFIFLYNDQALGFVGTSLLAVVTIIFILHLENDLSIGKIKQSERKYRGMVDNLPVGFYRATLNGILLEYNAELIKILGLDTEKEYTGLELPNFWQDANQAETMEKLIIGAYPVWCSFPIPEVCYIPV